MIKFLKWTVLPVACVCMTLAVSDVSFAQVEIKDQKAESPAKSKTQVKSSMPSASTPYTLDRGRRDPFVPFGGNVAPPSTVRDKKGGSVPVAKPTSETKTNVTVGGSTVKEVVSELPVKVTGTMVSSGTSYAILTAASGSGSSFMVKPGDKVGEYTVQSVYPDRVVLLWGGKAYNVPVKAAASSAPKAGIKSGGKTTGQESLPVPEVKEEEKAPPAPSATESKSEETKKDSENK